jgi:hypothetical protein
MRWNPRALRRWPVLLGLLLPLGCGEVGTSLVPVSGRVLMDNRPLANATVQFSPVGKPGDELGPLSFGTTDAEGHFALKTVVKGHDLDGAVAGKHRVQISIMNRTVGAGSKLGEQLPYRYNRHSKLEFTVPPEGTQEANFLNLTRK